jgi:hypothetical protein
MRECVVGSDTDLGDRGLWSQRVSNKGRQVGVTHLEGPPRPARRRHSVRWLARAWVPLESAPNAHRPLENSPAGGGDINP